MKKKASKKGAPLEPSVSGSDGERRSKGAGGAFAAGGSGDKRTLRRRCKGCVWVERIGEGIVFCLFPQCVRGKLRTGGSKKDGDNERQKKKG